jgi:histidinol dehydrogenase
MPYNFLKVEKLKDRSQIQYWDEKSFSFNTEAVNLVEQITGDVKKSGDKALLKYCKRFDGIDAKSIADIKVDAKEIVIAAEIVPKKYHELVKAINAAYKNIKRYHCYQFKKEPKSWFMSSSNERRLGQVITAIERVGIYIPGGRYLYPSSVLMTAVPAIIAGVKEIAVCTPPDKTNRISDILLYIFSKLGINEIYKIGGAQAIAALAFGTESIKKVNKIVGPGNIYVTAAKKLVYGIVGIDSLAGPSEILIIADDNANSSYIAADIIAQAEHDTNARSMLFTTSENLAEEVIDKIYSQIEFLLNKYKDRISRDVIIESLKNNCKIFYNSDINFLIDICNFIAPEHLEIMVKNHNSVLSKLKNVGAIFLGSSTPVAVGDYICGTNHVIPTGGNVKFSSPLGVYDFLKKSSVAFYDLKTLKKEAKFIQTLADFENLLAHKRSVGIRMEDEN